MAFYLDKRTAPYVIWTLVFLACAIYFWLARSADRPGAISSASQGTSTYGSRGKRRRMVSVGLNGTLLGALPGGTINEVAVTPFLDLCATSEVFAVALAETDAHEDEVHQVLESIGAFNAGLRKHRVMFSSTPEGRASMVRQLQPAVHLEATKSVAEALEGKVQQVRIIGSPAWPTFMDGARLDGHGG